MIGSFVLIRTANAGVHCGTLEKDNDTTVVLTNARRVWRWNGANTLHELALRGANLKQSTRISEPIERIKVVGVIEIIPCTDDARENLQQSRWLG